MVQAKLKIDGLVEAQCESADLEGIWREIMHYAAQYMADPWSKSFIIEIKKD